MNHVILAINLVAFISGSAALACLRVLLRQRPGAQARRIQYVLLCLTFIVACNGVDFYARAFAGVRDERVAFITMNLLSLVTLASLFLLFRAIEDLVRRKFSRVAWAVFWVQAFCTYFACMSRSLFTPGGSIDASAGYFISAIDTVACLFVAAILCVVYFGAIDSKFRPFVGFLVPFSFAWIAVDAASEIGLFSKWLGFPRMAMSPFFLVIISVLTISRSMKLFGHVGSDPAGGSGETGSDSAGFASAGTEFRPDLGWDLSSREMDVLALLVKGLENAEISATLFISPHTVKNHVSSIYRKSGAKNRLDLIRILGGTGQDSFPGK